MKKFSILLERLHASVILAGIVAAVFVSLFLFATVIFLFGEPHNGDPGDLIRWGLYLVNEAPILGIVVILMAIYAIIFLTKFFEGFER